MNLRIYYPLVLLFTIACAPVTSVTRLSQSEFPARPHDCVIQTITQAPANRKYVEIAVLSTVKNGPFSPDELSSMLPIIKATACELGADAILIKSFEPNSDSAVAHTLTVAIKYLD